MQCINELVWNCFFPPNCSLYFCGTDAIMPPWLPCREKKKKSTKQNFVYQENKAWRITCDTHQHKDSSASPESGQNKSRQFLLTITRQNTEALYLLKCKFIQGFMLPCCKYQIPLKTVEQEWIDFPPSLDHLQILIAWHYINAKLKILHSKTIREICEVQAVYSLNYMIDFLCSYLLYLNHFSSLFNWFLRVLCRSLNNLSLVHISFISVLIYIYRPRAAESILIFFQHFGIQSLVICDECSFSFMVLKFLRGNLIRFAFVWVICPSEMLGAGGDNIHHGAQWKPGTQPGREAGLLWGTYSLPMSSASSRHFIIFINSFERVNAS